MTAGATLSVADARQAVLDCEKEIQSVKGALRRIGASTDDDDKPNSLEIVLLKVEGLPEAAGTPSVALQLSSPIEEITLTKQFDPLNADPAPEGSSALFKDVDASMATLSVSAKDADIPLGSSTTYDLSPLCAFEAMEFKDSYVTELAVAIFPEGSDKMAAAAEPAGAPVEPEDTEEKDEEKEKEEEKTDLVTEAGSEDKEKDVGNAAATGDSDDKGEDDGVKVEADEPTDDSGEKTTSAAQDAGVETDAAEKKDESDTKDETDAKTETLGDEADASLILPVCTLTLRITFKPSVKDRREELHSLLNKVSQKKAEAMGNLKAAATAASRSAPPAPSSTTLSKPAVKPGFLNKKKKKEPTKMEVFYERLFGPQSILIRGASLVVIARNYIIFGGAVAFFHFKGQLLALPPPV